ncbi:hypothetical protein NEHOM01_2203 [Nematocida homosporus]|uniref:uncharacterized protein n=1 Tax=Nematocida homosporus TaxID=1912981 RepID=UPI00221FFF9E|nr:uncharacterized protein NEHOM01_2203 [Nematocida homosporus]KAI5187470.1 hypothetical protein NEHOM01_2203 [Nematocida homosporus]
MPYLKNRTNLGINENYPSTILMWMVVIGLLVLVDVVCGSAEDSEDELACGSRVGSENDSAGWKKSGEMAARLKKLGFLLDCGVMAVLARPYTPEQSTLVDSDANPSLNSNVSEEMPDLSIVQVRSKSIDFTLPEYSSAEEANAAFKLLNTIAAIKTIEVLVNYTETESKWHQTNILIITRVINMIDCKRLKLNLKCNLEYNSKNQSIYNASLREAEKVIGLTPKSSCTLVVMNLFLLCWSDSTIAILQPFSSIHFVQIHTLPQNLDGLCLTANFKIVVFPKSNQRNVNLTFLSSVSTKCSEVKINPADKPFLTILGLEMCTKQHPEITLVLNWTNLQSLGRQPLNLQPKGKIHVHTIMIQDNHLLHTKPTSLMRNPKKPVEKRIFATNLVVLAGRNFPCRRYEPFLGNYIKDACANYVTLTGTAEVRYKDERTDFYDTLEVFRTLGILTRSEIESFSNNVCCGTKLKNTEHITIKKPITLQLTSWVKMCDNNKLRKDLAFCQHIHYTDITIDGEEEYTFNPFNAVVDMLKRLRCITTHKLTIQNFYVFYCINPLDLFKFNKLLCKLPQYTMEVDVLVLDNAPSMVVEWLLGTYNFVKPTEVVILTPYCNLSLIQILSHPKGRNISKLVFRNLDRLKDIDLLANSNRSICIQGSHVCQKYNFFRYVEKRWKRGITPMALGLDRLVLQFDGTNQCLSAEMLSKATSLRFQEQLSLRFFDYIKVALVMRLAIADSPWFNETSGELKLAGLTLKVLNDDLASHKEEVRFKVDLITYPTRPVCRLVLHFRDGVVVTRAILLDIILWANFRFVGLKVLTLSNLEVPEGQIDEPGTPNYVPFYTGSLTSIQIIDNTSRIWNVKQPRSLPPRCPRQPPFQSELFIGA